MMVLKRNCQRKGNALSERKLKQLWDDDEYERKMADYARGIQQSESIMFWAIVLMFVLVVIKVW